MSIIFVDTETTGLDPERHEIWEIALIEEDGTEHGWRVKPQRLYDADPSALRINHYYERIALASLDDFFTRPAVVAWEVARLTSGKHLVGAVPSFDDKFLTRFLAREGYAPAWHYHLIDVETLVAGRLGLRPPWGSHELTDALAVALAVSPVEKIAIPNFGTEHTALADARWAKWLYEMAYYPKGT